VVSAPALQKDQHADTAAPNGAHFRKVQHNHVGRRLGRNRVTQFEGLITPDKPAFAFHHRHVTDLINMYVGHDSLRM
jgi:hypothetical protein